MNNSSNPRPEECSELSHLAKIVTSAKKAKLETDHKLSVDLLRDVDLALEKIKDHNLGAEQFANALGCKADDRDDLHDLEMLVKAFKETRAAIVEVAKKQIGRRYPAATASLRRQEHEDE